jgi:Phage protein (N4 Gp49/phage Sf6 gene 66) family
MEAMNETQIENKIQEKGLNAPRLNPAHIDATIVGEEFHLFETSKKTICQLTLRNGFTVIGEAGVVSPENFNAEIGRDVARKNAREKIWQLEGYLLKQKLFEQADAADVGNQA